MQYIKRHMEQTLDAESKMFGSICVTGARQTGKSTLLQEKYSDIRSVSFDDKRILQQVRTDAGSFFEIYEPPILLDEIQYAPDLFPYVKLLLDKTRKKGLVYMSGSQKFHLMKNITESLAGRVGILELLGLSLREMGGEDFRDDFLPTKDYIMKRNKCKRAMHWQDIWHCIWRGSYPELVSNPDYVWDRFYGNYIQTYIERDVSALAQVGDTVKFYSFMQAAAAMTGQLLNVASLARDVGISNTAAESWLSILKVSNIIYLLRPYHNNMIKRAVKTPKLYFLDTGLACYLTRWDNEDVLKFGAMSGAMFESFVVAEILKSYANNGHEADIYFYRDKEQNEIDLIIHQNGTLYPIEIKKHSDPSASDVSAFAKLDAIADKKRGEGAVICTYDGILTLKDGIRAIGVNYI